MTREEAKEILTHNWTRVDNPNYSESELDEAFFMAIEALTAYSVHKPDYSYEAGMIRRLKEAQSVDAEQVTSKLKSVEISTDKGDKSTMSQPNGKLESADVAPKIDHDREWIIGCIKHDGFIKTDRFDKANQIILDALSADAEHSWIPCSERLPRDDEIVNITWVNHNPPPYYADIEGKPFVASGLRYRDKWYWYSSVCQDLHQDFDIIDKDIEVIAWQPLPTPYKGGESE